MGHRLEEKKKNKYECPVEIRTGKFFLGWTLNDFGVCFFLRGPISILIGEEGEEKKCMPKTNRQHFEHELKLLAEATSRL